MAIVRNFNLGGLNLKLNPLIHKEGDFIRCINVDNDLFGAKKRRGGYTTYLNNPDSQPVTQLFDWHRNDGTTFWNYRVSSNIIYYSTQGTGNWLPCGNGTMAAGTVGYAVGFDNATRTDIMVVGDGVGTGLYTTSGTSFVNSGSIPIGAHMADFQGRVWIGGTSSNAFFSTVYAPTDWVTDSDNVVIPGGGKINSVFKQNDRLVFGKNTGALYRYDGYALVDLATNLGPTSKASLGLVEDYRFYLNRLGIYGYNGDRPQLTSNLIEKQIYNDSGGGVVGTVFDSAPGVVHQYNYYLSVGSVTDDLTSETVNNCIFKYDYQLNDFGNYSYADRPTAFNSYKDASGNQQLIFGDSTGQAYTVSGTALSDNGKPIESIMEFSLDGQSPETEKSWNYLWFFFNPGNEAHVQVAAANTYTKGKKKWIDLGDCSDGLVEFKPKSGLRSNILFVKITDNSRTSRFSFLGYAYDATPILRR